MSNVVGHSRSPLNRVITEAPVGLLLDLQWLSERGATRQLADYYADRGWLDRVAHGLYRLPQPPNGAASSTAPDWVVPIISAQWLKYDIHVGGPTALELHGHTHYLPLGNREVAYLYSDKPPAWLKRLGLQTELHIRTKKLFTDPELGVQLARPGTLTASTLSPWEFSVRIATSERAILEALDELPRHVDFGTIDMIFESLTSLRPRLLNSLLRSCRSVKVKRLFFVYADNHGHAWRDHLDATSFDLGSGKRSLSPGGRLHPHYHITVPEDLLPHTEDETNGP